MIFNDIDLRSFFRVKDIRKAMLPSIDNSMPYIPGKPGRRQRKTNLDIGHIEVDIRVKERNKSCLNRSIRHLASLLYTDEVKELRLPDEEGIYYLAKLDGRTDLERILTYYDTTLYFICPDPIAFGDRKVFDLTKNPTIYNLGTYPTNGTITVEITENVDNIQATLLNTGEFIYLGHDFVVGDIVTIDLDNEMAYKNGYSIMKDCYLESDFFDIPTGEFEISVSSGNATLEYIERWL